MSPRVSPRGALLLTMGLFAGAVVGGQALHGDARTMVVDGFGILAVWMSSLVCALAVWRVGLRRWEVLLSAAAVISFAAGLTYVGVVVTLGGTPLFPSLGDVGYLLFYPLMLAALGVEVLHDGRWRAWSMWLDCAVGSLGAASVLIILLHPVLISATTGTWSLAAAAASMGYPFLDLLLLAAVAGIAAMRGVRMGSRWGLLVVGLMAFAGADMIIALQRTDGTFVTGTPLDMGWGIGVPLIALYVDSTARRDTSPTQEASPSTGASALVVSAVATAAGLGVLVTGTRVHLSNAAVVLAAVTLLAAAARTQIAFRQLVRMADLRRQATTDYLTGLPNRRSLYLQAERRLADPKARRQALLILDLDKFKEVNDSLGHHIGDQLLVKVGARLGENLRSNDLLVRLGGDEFAVLLDNAGHDQAAAVATKLCAVLTEPFDLEDIAVHSAASIGIALFPDDGPDLSALLRKADVAMYKAKAHGDRHHVYGDEDETDLATRMRTVGELRTALISDQLLLHYQPKVDLRTGEVNGVEALVRWDHPSRGLLYPDAFLDLVEESGLMRVMTRVVLEMALDQAALWRAGGRALTIAVNLSASSLVDTDLPDEVATLLAARELAPGTLQLEITEEFLMADRDRAQSILARLRRLGIQIAVDDFGTGYSSLAYLRDLPVDELKLDRSFVLPMVDDPRAAALVASTISLAHSLDLRMVAEGVENETTLTELTRLGCDQAQGYHMCRPVPAAELDDWLSIRLATVDLRDVPDLLPVAASD